MLLAPLVLSALQAAAPPSDRVAKVERWLSIVQHHVPGTNDEGVREIAAWDPAELSQLFVDLQSLATLMRAPGRVLYYRPRGSRQDVRLYTQTQAARMNVLACVAGGIIASDPECLRRKAGTELTEDLSRLAMLSFDARGVGADNYILKYGALLHTDVALFAPDTAVPLSSGGPGPQRFRVDMADGQPTSIHQSAVHWEISRMLLDEVRPTRAGKPAPGRDDMVHDWYIATAAFMQYFVHYDTTHLERARQLFPNDRDILFLCATQHAIYATPRIQNVAKTVVLPSGYFMQMSGDREELRQSQALLRRALTVDSQFAEGRVRLGRVLALQRQFAEAERELNEAIPALEDRPNQYYAQLFLGSVEESLGKFDAAKSAYERAASLYPSAQSPLVALAQLARRRGDRAGALRTMEILFALPGDAEGRRDPWWTFDTWHARDAEDRLVELWQQFQQEPPQ
jgi:hypothetical protein